jgi:hypothetical protein
MTYEVNKQYPNDSHDIMVSPGMGGNVSIKIEDYGLYVAATLFYVPQGIKALSPVAKQRILIFNVKE